MSLEAGPSGSQSRAALQGRAILAVAAGCFVFAGLLLWGRYGDAVFNDMVWAALAWCF